VGLFNKKTKGNPEKRTEQLGNVTPDRIRIQSSTGRPYPPQMNFTQPGEYGLRVRFNKAFEENLRKIVGNSSKVWSKEVRVVPEVTKRGTLLRIYFEDLEIGVVSESAALEHEEILAGAQSGRDFRASVENDNFGLQVRLFMSL
jgi:hypothetical protein